MSRTWAYGDAGDRWPVQPGEIWSVGRHTLACGDVTHSAGLELIAKTAVPDFALTDPPWNQGNANAFRTKAGLPPGDWDLFLDRLFKTLVLTKQEVLMETRVGGEADLLPRLNAWYGRHIATLPMTYYHKRPCSLFICRLDAQESCLFPPWAGLDGCDDSAFPRLALNRLAECYGPGPYRVFDPCCGRGLMAEATERVGYTFIGLELHPRRLAVTIDKLARCGYTPQKVGELVTMRSRA